MYLNPVLLLIIIVIIMIINLIIIILIKPIKNCNKVTNWKTTQVIQFLDKSYFSHFLLRSLLLQA